LGAIGTSWPLPSRSAREGKLMWRVKKHKKKKKKKQKQIRRRRRTTHISKGSYFLFY